MIGGGSMGARRVDGRRWVDGCAAGRWERDGLINRAPITGMAAGFWMRGGIWVGGGSLVGGGLVNRAPTSWYMASHDA